MYLLRMRKPLDNILLHVILLQLLSNAIIIIWNYRGMLYLFKFSTEVHTEDNILIVVSFSAFLTLYLEKKYYSMYSNAFIWQRILETSPADYWGKMLNEIV